MQAPQFLTLFQCSWIDLGLSLAEGHRDTKSPGWHAAQGDRDPGFFSFVSILWTQFQSWVPRQSLRWSLPFSSNITSTFHLSGRINKKKNGTSSPKIYLVCLTFSIVLEILAKGIRQEKEKKIWHRDSKGRSEIISVCRWHEFTYRKP